MNAAALFWPSPSKEVPLLRSPERLRRATVAEIVAAIDAIPTEVLGDEPQSGSIGDPPELIADDRLRSALLSRLILAGFSEVDASEAANLVAGLVWFVIAASRLQREE